MIGSNVLRDVHQALEKSLGPGYLSQLKKNSSSKKFGWANVLALYEEVSVDHSNGSICNVRVAGRDPVLIPANSIKVIEGTVMATRKGERYDAVIERHEVILQSGLVLGPALVEVNKTGRVPFQIANFSEEDIYLKPRTPVGQLNYASQEPSYKTVEVSDCEVRMEPVNTEASYIQEIVKKMDIGDGLGDHEKQQLHSILEKHQGIFSRSEDDIGYCAEVKHRINTVDDVPVKVPHRRIPPHQWGEVREYIDRALNAGIIRESCSPYAAPVVLVRKKDNKLRLCCDFRALNLKTHKDAYPLPRVDEALQVLNGAKYFCCLDLAHGFNQLPVEERDIEKNSF